jgi:hypothetical protein
MADTNSDLIAAKLAARTGLANGIVNGDDAGGILTFYNVEVATTTGTAANDTFQLIDLPPGAVIVPELCSITASGDPGTTLTIDVGDSGDVDRYCDGANLGALSAAGIVLFTAPAIPAAVLTPYRNNEDVTRIYATAATAGTVSAVTLKFSIVARIKG